MEKMIELKDLLKHELQDLYSAEEQIIEALPLMVENAKNPTLKKALSEHLKVTKEQKTRLDEALKLMGLESEEDNKKKGFFSTLFGESGGSKCKGMEGLIEEGEKIMDQDMTPEVMDAAIIASAQKIEHYEICGYGTARAYARELKNRELAILLETTLNEEYKADDLLTELAVGKINEEADAGFEGNGRSQHNGSNGHSVTNRAASKKNGSNAKRKSSNGTPKSKSTKKSISRASNKTKSSSKRKSGLKSKSRSK